MRKKKKRNFKSRNFAWALNPHSHTRCRETALQASDQRLQTVLTSQNQLVFLDTCRITGFSHICSSWGRQADSENLEWTGPQQLLDLRLCEQQIWSSCYAVCSETTNAHKKWKTAHGHAKGREDLLCCFIMSSLSWCPKQRSRICQPIWKHARF